jgi:hypothetical protein
MRLAMRVAVAAPTSEAQTTRLGAAKATTRAVVGVAAALAVMGFAAACGGSGGDNQGTPAAANFADCLRQHGIALPTGRASGFPTARPDAFPSGRPSGFPGGRPTARPSGGFGQGQGQGQGQGGFGNFQRPEGVDEQTWQKAMEACNSLRPSGFPGRGGFNGSRGPGQGNGALAAYFNCLSEHGVTYSPGQTLPDAAKVCEVLRPSGTATP